MKIIIILALTLGLYMCFSGSDGVSQSTRIADKRLSKLQTDLDNGLLRNARLIEKYANYLKGKKPDLAPLIEELSLDSSSRGPMFTSLKTRLQTAKQDKSQFSSTKERVGELRAIGYAAQSNIFNSALSDVVNTLASMSDGRLPKIAGGPTSKPGQQLVGNPSYGHWRSDSSGSSFWEWYGKYAMFSSVMNMGFGQRYYYNNWAQSRPRSYYSDRGRNYFSSSRDLKSQNTVEAKRKDKFQRSGKSYKSTYSKFGGNKRGSSSFSRSSFKSGGHSYFSSSRSGFGGGK